MKRAIYTGSFDPVTYGHLDVINRASNMVDELIVAVLKNSAKTPLFSIEERVKMLKEVTKDIPNVSVTSFEGLAIDFADEMNAHIIVRGLRAVTDFEYELQLSQTNNALYGDLKTVFLITKPEYNFISSSMVREILANNGDISKFVPKAVEEFLISKHGI